MYNLPKIVLIILLAATTSFAAKPPSKPDATGVQVLEHYIDLLSTDNIDIARDMWSPTALERAERFGITFSDIVLKVDCSSPVIRQLDGIRYSQRPMVRSYELLDDGAWVKLQFHYILGSDKLEYEYYGRRSGDWYWFDFPQNYYGDSWPIRESQYLRVHVDPQVETFINDAVLDETDRFIERTATKLGISANGLAELAKSKIEYFYCGSDTIIQQITGHLIKGTLDLASNDIISATFPHFHELTHLLVNIKLQTLPLYTHPVVREGLATALGGRWGKNTNALMELGIFLHREELVSWDALLTMDGFQRDAGADIAYPVAGLFNLFLIDQLGMDHFLDLYRSLSGKFQPLWELKAIDVQAIVTEQTKHADWPSLVADFEKYLDSYTTDFGTARPGIENGGDEILVGENFRVIDHGDWIGFEFVGRQADQTLTGNLLFGHDTRLDNQISSLFVEHYTGEFQLDGRRFGVRYDRHEAGVYDYATNQLLAKYIWGLAPSEKYFDEQQNRVRVSFRKEILAEQLPTPNDHILLSH